MTTAAVQEAAMTPEEAQALIEKYKDLKIPTTNIVMVAAVAVFLIAIIVVGFIYISRHYANFSNGIFSGILAELLFGYVAYGAIIFGIDQIKAAETYFASHQEIESLYQIILSIICQCLAVYLGVKYLFRMNRRQNKETSIGSVLTFGLAMYAASVLVGSEITFAIEYIMVSSTVNGMGVGLTIYEIMQSGISEEVALASVRGMIDTNWLEFLWDGLTYVFRAMTETAAAVLIYGVTKHLLEKKWLYAAFGMLTAFFLPSLLRSLLHIRSVWPPTILLVLITAASCFVALRLIFTRMPEEEEDLKRKRVKIKKTDDKDKKMPKIVMPD